jgi:sulfur-oxidizing protein SoxA
MAAVLTFAAELERPSPPKPGSAFVGADVRSLQQDDFANPGMHWVARGETLWKGGNGGEKSCAGCHGDAATGMRGVATRYPRVDPEPATLVNLEGRINLCRVRHQHAQAYAYESDELLSLTAYVAYQSRGMPSAVELDEQNRAHFERGRDFYYRRQGQMNLACAHCHQRNWGRHLRTETITQGHGTDYPAYRFEWQTLGSLHRRFRSCLYGIRAEMLPAGSPEFLDLELFLAWRAQGLPIGAPGVRR